MVVDKDTENDSVPAVITVVVTMRAYIAPFVENPYAPDEVSDADCSGFPETWRHEAAYQLTESLES